MKINLLNTMATQTYLKLCRQIAALEIEAESAKKRETANVIRQTLKTLAMYGLTPADLIQTKVPASSPGIAGKKSVGESAPVLQQQLASLTKKETAPDAKRTMAPKSSGDKTVDKKVYSDGLGNSWSGRGPAPKWLKLAMAGRKSREEFLVSN